MPEPVEPVERTGPYPRRPEYYKQLKFTRKELESRNHDKNAVVIINNVVYDVTDLLWEHPGGHTVLLNRAGQDATACFLEVGHSDVAIEWRKEYEIGEVVDADKWEEMKPPTPVPDPEPEDGLLRKIIDSFMTPLVVIVLTVYICKMLFE